MKKNIIVTALFFILISSSAPSWGTLNDDIGFNKKERREQHKLSVNRRSPDYILNYLQQFPEDSVAQNYLYSYFTNKKFYEPIKSKPRKNEAMVIYQKSLGLGFSWPKTKHEKDDEKKYSFLIYTITKTKGKNDLKKKINALLKKEGCYPMAYMRLVEFMRRSKSNIIKSTFLFFEEKFQAKILESLDSDKNYYMKDSLRDKKAKFFLMMGKPALQGGDFSIINFNYFLISAKLGHVSAMYNVGLLFRDGVGEQAPDEAKALEFFKKAADLEDTDAMYNAGVLLRDGIGKQTPDKAEALKFFLKAAKLKHAYAMHNAGALLRDGFEGQPSNKAKAMELFLEAAELGIASAMNNAGVLFRDGFGEQAPDEVKALEFFKKAADLECTNAMYNAGVLLRDGVGKQTPDKAEALKFFLKAAKLKHAYAMYNAGVLLYGGFDGQPSNKAKALELFLEAAKFGHAVAMYAAGVLLNNGFEGQPPNKAEALKLFLEAARLKNADAMNNAGVLLRDGVGKQTPDKAKAMELFLEAAELENADAMNNAGALFMEGFGEQKPDKAKALEFFKKGAELENASAMFNAGLLLINTPDSNVKEAFEFFYNAIEKEPDNKSLIVTMAICLLNTGNSELIDEGLFFLRKASALGSDRAKKYIEYSEKDSNKDGNQDQEFSDMLKATVQKPMVSVEGIATPQLDAVINNISSETDSREDNNEESSKEEYEGESEEESEEEVDDAKYKVDERHIFPNKKSITVNGKYIIEQLRKAHRKSIVVSEQTLLSKNSQGIFDRIINGDLRININDIVKLFKEPYFKNQVIVKGTKNGIMIVAHNRKTNKHETISMHRQHTKKRKKGLEPAFINDLGDVLKLFGSSL